MALLLAMDLRKSLFNLVMLVCQCHYNYSPPIWGFHPAQDLSSHIDETQHFSLALKYFETHTDQINII